MLERAEPLVLLVLAWRYMVPEKSSPSFFTVALTNCFAPFVFADVAVGQQDVFFGGD